MKYRRIIVETTGGRLISIIRDKDCDPGDVDYYILWKDIPSIPGITGGKVATAAIVEELVEAGIMRPG